MKPQQETNDINSDSNVKMTPLQKSVIDQLRNLIHTGQLPSGVAIPSGESLATQLGVSRGLVRFAVDTLVESGDIVREKNCRPIAMGQLIQSVPTHQFTGHDIAVWVHLSMADNPSMAFVKSLSTSLAHSKYRLVVREPSCLDQDVQDAEEARFLDKATKSDDTVAVIVWRSEHSHNINLIKLLLATGKPVAFVDLPAPGRIKTDFIGTSNRTATRRCVQHLVDLGHSHIGFVAESSLPFSVQERMRGFQYASHQLLPHSEPLIVIGEVSIQSRPSQSFVQTLIGRFPEAKQRNPIALYSNAHYGLAVSIVNQLTASASIPTGLIIAYDVLAWWVITELEMRGIRVPQDISVVGFDGRAQCAGLTKDLLSTATQDFAGIGLTAGDLILDRLENPYHLQTESILLDAPFYQGSTTAPASNSINYSPKELMVRLMD